MDLRLSFTFVRLLATALTIRLVLQWTIFPFSGCNGEGDWALEEDDDPGKFFSSHFFRFLWCDCVRLHKYEQRVASAHTHTFFSLFLVSFEKVLLVIIISKLGFFSPHSPFIVPILA